MRFLKAILLLIVFFVGLLFFVQNSDVLGHKMALVFDLYVGGLQWATAEVPFYFLVIVAFALGMLLGIVLMFMDRMRIYCELRATRKEAKASEKALKDLKKTLSEAAQAQTPQVADQAHSAS